MTSSPVDTPGPIRVAEADERHDHLSLHVWTSADGDDLGLYWVRNRKHLTPTQPLRPDAFWTAEGQQRRLEAALVEVAAGRLWPFLIREGGELVGEVIISDIARGFFDSCNISYSVDEARLRRGIASWAVGAAVDVAFTECELHRVQAATLLDNVGSHGVLQRAGFSRIGVARDYLAIGGTWRDHILWQRVNGAASTSGGQATTPP